MKFEIKRKDALDWIILTLSLSYVLLLIWAHVFTNKIPMILLTLMICSLIYNNLRMEIKTIDGLALILIIVTGILFVSNVIGSSGINVSENINKILSSSIILIYYAYIVNLKTDFVKNYLKRILPIINGYFIVNNVLMLIQAQGNYFLVDTQSNGNVYYVDMITGFIGADGTHCVTIFTMFTIILNLCFVNEQIIQVRFKSYIYVFISILLPLFVATKNDNKGLFILLPMILVIYFLYRTKINIYNLFTRFWKPILVVLVGLLVLNIISHSSNPELADIANKLNITINSYALKSGQITSVDERFRLYMIAWINGGLWGKGWGSIKMFADQSINHHFGMTAIQPIVYMGGMVFYISYNVCMAKLFAGKSTGYVKRWILFFVLMTFMSYFTQIYIIDRVTYFMAFLCVAIRLLPQNTITMRIAEEGN